MADLNRFNELLEEIREESLISQNMYEKIQKEINLNLKIKKLSESKSPLTDVKVYVDGSYNADEDRYGYGVAIESDGKVVECFYGQGSCEAGGRNIEGEVAGARFAMQHMSFMGVKYELIYDYEGIGKWAKGEWNAFEAYTYAYQRHASNYLGDITFTHVNGHSGVLGNSVADALAKAGCGVPFVSEDRKALSAVSIDAEKLYRPSCDCKNEYSLIGDYMSCFSQYPNRIDLGLYKVPVLDQCEEDDYER